MHKPALSAALQAFASIELRDAVYVACAVSSGRRELDLMLAASQFDRAVLRAQLVHRWVRDVLEPNRADARAAATRTRARYPGRSVINPSEFDIDGLDQPGYDVLCERIIRGHVTRIVLADGWEFSRGARVEAALGAELGLAMEDGAGRRMTEHDVWATCEKSEAALVEAGFPEHRVRELLPPTTGAAATR
ncbi:DUF4406 domain-containing protein [Saccharothrix sp. S26]|uniref:DUF4406 domain-containing protein n=1 Tax=Saccharothrix sp. S26 TaxID=2907215 RepID=UPI001F16C9BD|nr:DUF4406 domain-containing protein [Saccharothrix sp. S26]MCE6995011.1 DUF4406 domain-containing protein [Saccharothrix sp. S26]